MEPNVYYLVHRTPPLDPILNYMSPFHNFPPNFPKINPNTILPSTLRSSALFFSVQFSDQSVKRISYVSHPCYILGTSHPL
jgi:hypothetical protein